MLKVSAFYLEKQKSFIAKKNIFQAIVNIKTKKFYFKKKYFLSHRHYQNKKALFNHPIFSEGFERSILFDFYFMYRSYKCFHTQFLDPTVRFFVFREKNSQIGLEISIFSEK